MLPMRLLPPGISQPSQRDAAGSTRCALSQNGKNQWIAATAANQVTRLSGSPTLVKSR